MTNWISDENGTLRFTCQGWTLTRWSGSLNEVSAQHEDDDLVLDIDGSEIRTFGEHRSHSYGGGMAMSVRIPFPVLRAILEVHDPEGGS